MGRVFRGGGPYLKVNKGEKEVGLVSSICCLAALGTVVWGLPATAFISGHPAPTPLFVECFSSLPLSKLCPSLVPSFQAFFWVSNELICDK